MPYHILDNKVIRFSRDKDRILGFLGIDMQADMPILFQVGRFIVFKRNGFTGWSGVGQTSYYPPRYYLIELKNESIVCCVHKDIEATQKTWCGIKNDLIIKAKLLQISSEEE